MKSSATASRRARSSERARPRIVVTCEHASNRVPRRYAPIFPDGGGLLASHRGYDIGALDLARRLARRLGAPLHSGRVTRLIVDLNRSPGHPGLHSRYLDRLDRTDLRRVVERYYLPYRTAVEERIARAARPGAPVLHLSVHSFTPVLRGVRRNADVGLLYDPARRAESRLASAWQGALVDLAPSLRVRRNYPYRGIDDGFIPFLRRRFSEARYVAIEIEVNQARLRSPRSVARMARLLLTSLREVPFDRRQTRGPGREARSGRILRV